MDKDYYLEQIEKEAFSLAGVGKGIGGFAKRVATKPGRMMAESKNMKEVGKQVLDSGAISKVHADKLTSDLATANKTIANHAADLAAKDTANTNAINSLKNSHTKQINNLNTAHAEELAAKDTAHASEIGKLNTAHAGELNTQKQTAKRNLAIGAGAAGIGGVAMGTGLGKGTGTGNSTAPVINKYGEELAEEVEKIALLGALTTIGTLGAGAGALKGVQKIKDAFKASKATKAGEEVFDVVKGKAKIKELEQTAKDNKYKIKDMEEAAKAKDLAHSNELALQKQRANTHAALAAGGAGVAGMALTNKSASSGGSAPVINRYADIFADEVEKIAIEKVAGWKELKEAKGLYKELKEGKKVYAEAHVKGLNEEKDKLKKELRDLKSSGEKTETAHKSELALQKQRANTHTAIALGGGGAAGLTYANKNNGNSGSAPVINRYAEIYSDEVEKTALLATGALLAGAKAGTALSGAVKAGLAAKGAGAGAAGIGALALKAGAAGKGAVAAGKAGLAAKSGLVAKALGAAKANKAITAGGAGLAEGTILGKTLGKIKGSKALANSQKEMEALKATHAEELAKAKSGNAKKVGLGVLGGAGLTGIAASSHSKTQE